MDHSNRRDSNIAAEEIMVLNAISLVSARMARRLAALAKQGQPEEGGKHYEQNYVFSQDAVDQFGWVWATNTWDDVTVPTNLKTKAEEWLSSTQFETMSLKLTAADLSELGHDYDAFAEGDRIHCLAKPYGMDIVLPVMKLTIPLQNPAGRTLELSSKQQKTYTSQQSAVRNQLRSEQNDAINISNRNIQISIDNLTAMMTGAKGGYKLTEYDEDGRWLRDLYMDTPDKTTAKRIMQINKDGIAASTTGYEGPYTVGITVDGQILGSWIAANSIDTNHLSIGLNAWIKGTDDGIASKVEKDGIISAINQSSEEVAIQAKRINLNGSVTANNYFKIKTDGSMEAIAGQIGGFNINSDCIYLREDVTDKQIAANLVSNPSFKYRFYGAAAKTTAPY